MNGFQGMYLEGSPDRNPDGTSRRNDDIRLTSDGQAVQVDLAPEHVATLPGLCVGTVALGPGAFCCVLESEIGLFEAGLYRRVLDLGGPTYAASRLVSGTWTQNALGQRLVLLVAEGTAPRLVNLDDPLPAAATEVFAAFTPPAVNARMEAGGNLLAGNYVPLVQVENKAGGRSPWYYDFQPLPATSGEGGTPTGKPTPQSLVVTVSALTGAHRLRVGFIRQCEGKTEPFLARELVLTGASVTVTITGEEALTVLPLDEVLVETPRYTSASALTQAGGAVYLADMTEAVESDLQPFVNAVQVKWVARRVFPWDVRAGASRGFQPGEVYALYLRRLYKKKVGRWYPLPGRTAMGSDLTYMASAPYYREGEASPPGRRFLAEDTVPPFVESDGDARLGTMGYWENEGETYAPGTTGLAGQTVRHHRMPTLDFLRRNAYNDSKFGVDWLVKLGLRLEDVQFPADQDAVGWQVGYAVRGDGGLVAGMSDVLLGFSVHGPDGPGGSTEYMSTGMNLRVATYGPDEDGGQLSRRRVRLSVGEGLLAPVGFGADYLRVEYGLTSKARHIGNYAQSGQALRFDVEVLPQTSAVTGGSLHPLKSLRFVPPNGYLPVGEIIWDHLLSEAGFGADLLTDLPVSGAGTFAQWITLNHDEPGLATTLMRYRKTVYSGVTTQRVQTTGDAFSAPTGETFGGDAFTSRLGLFHSGRSEGAYLIFGAEKPEDRVQEGVWVARRTWVVGAHNWERRAQVPGNDATTDPLRQNRLPLSFTRDKAPNDLVAGVNPDYAWLGVPSAAEVHQPGRVYPTRHPDAIVRSAVENRDSLEGHGWLRYRAGDIYRVPGKGGGIVKLASDGDGLFIHCRHTLYRTRPRGRLQTAEGPLVQLGVGDLFDFDAVELQHSEMGALGLQHASAALMTPWGYVFFDAQRGEWWQVGQSLKPLSGPLASFWKGMVPAEDCPAAGQGFVLGVDGKRLLATVRVKRPKDLSRYRSDYDPRTVYQPGDVVMMEGVLRRLQ